MSCFRFKVPALACTGVLFLGAFLAMTPRARASEWNQKTIVTFSQPVEIPGEVLSPGTYVFKLADTLADRNIVEVYNKDENHLYGMFIAIPDYRLRPTGRPIITFEERASNSPQAVRAWFYPGDNYGHQFVYPRVKAAELAKVNRMPVASMPNELSAQAAKPANNMNEPNAMAMKKAPLKAEEPNGGQSEVAEAFPKAAPAPPAASESAAPAQPQELPQTASELPLFALLGLGLIAAGACAEIVRRRTVR